MPEILEVIKKHKDHESAEFIKELTEKVEALYNLGVQNGFKHVKEAVINFLNN